MRLKCPVSPVESPWIFIQRLVAMGKSTDFSCPSKNYDDNLPLASRFWFSFCLFPLLVLLGVYHCWTLRHLVFIFGRGLEKAHGMEVLQASPGKTLPAASGQLLRREAPATCQPCVQMGCPSLREVCGPAKPCTQNPVQRHPLSPFWFGGNLLEESTPKRVPSICGFAKKATHVSVPT